VDGNFTIDSQTLTESGGHQVSWTYQWNTAEITGAAKDNIDILFKALDFSSGLDIDSTIVDVVPYISGIERTLPTHRSKYGKFGVQEGETGVTLNGYNLAETGTNWVRVYNDAGGAYDTVNVTASGSPYTSMTVGLTDVTHSGWLRLAVNGIEAINNSNDNSLTSNKEDDGSGLGATRWTDDRYLRVWAVGDEFDQSGDPGSPSMSIQSDGTLYGAWTNSADAETYYAGTTGGSRTSVFEKYDPPEYSDLYVDANDNLNLAYLANYYDGNNNWGFLSIWNASAPRQNEAGGSWPNYNRVYLFEWLGNDDMLYQFQRPRIARSGNNIHMAYYDMNEKTMKYSYVQNGDAQTANEGTGVGAHPHLNLDGGEAYPSGNGQSGPLTALAGEFVAIDVDENGRPVILYYDISNQTLKLAHSNAAVPTAYGDWTIQTVFKADDPNRSFVGKYVTMKIDGNGNIHAACSRTSSGSLIYLYAPDADGADDYSFAYSVEVDAEGAVGTWADITLNGTTPYISYLNNSMVGTFDGLKMAYYDNGLSDWEYEIVPIITGINDKRTNLEYRKGTVDWQIAIGYASSSFDIVYLKPEE
jgi:large repetitive protein